MAKKFYIGTESECQNLVDRLNALYNYPTSDGKTITVSTVTKAIYNNDYNINIQENWVVDLTSDEVAKLVDTLPEDFILQDEQ